MPGPLTIEFDGYAIGPALPRESHRGCRLRPPEVGYGGQDSSRAYQALLDLGLNPLDEQMKSCCFAGDSIRCWRF